jgi:drug/metabolite transporter (DMT)-like permease
VTPSTATRGILMMIGAMVVFSLQDAVSKRLASTQPVIFITMIRYWFFALFVIALSARRSGGLRAVARTQLPWLQVGRGALLALEIWVMVTAFHVLGLAPSHAIFAVASLMVTAMSGPLLGEKIGWRRWTAVGVGFCGVLLILRPGAQVFDTRALIPLLAAFMFALYHIATRYTNRVDGAATSFFYTGVAGAVTVSLIGPFYWSSFQGWDWFWMGTLCISGITGHYLLINALEATEAGTLQPFTYLQLVFASALGIVLFGEKLDAPMVAGAALVVAAGLFTVWRERVRRVTPTPPTAP